MAAIWHMLLLARTASPVNFFPNLMLLSLKWQRKQNNKPVKMIPSKKTGTGSTPEAVSGINGSPDVRLIIYPGQKVRPPAKAKD